VKRATGPGKEAPGEADGQVGEGAEGDRRQFPTQRACADASGSRSQWRSRGGYAAISGEASGVWRKPDRLADRKLAMRLAPSRMRPGLQAGIGCVTKATWGRPVNARGFVVFYPRIEPPYDVLLRRASQDGRVPLESAGSAVPLRTQCGRVSDYEVRQPVDRLFPAVFVAPNCHASCARQCRNRFGWGGCSHVHSGGLDVQDRPCNAHRVPGGRGCEQINVTY
jgi:hypothetical protein